MAAALLIVMLLCASPAPAFYEDDDISMRASIRALAVAMENPDIPLLYKNRNDTVAGAMGRMELKAAWGGWAALELNAYALGYHNSGQGGAAGIVKLQAAERSVALERGLWENSHSKGEVALDWGNITFTYDWLDLKIGRQPVNLSSALYFTPNDFFAPFAADVFYRVYKAGVDAVRLEAGLGPLTQLTLLAVAGYDADPDSVNGFKAAPAQDRTSYVSRLSTVAMDYEFVVVGGQVRRWNVRGGSFQGTFFDWLGVRIEGHQAEPLDKGGKTRLEWTVELEHRFISSLDLRVALFHHGGGADKVDRYAEYLLTADSQSPYLARWYAAAGASYEFTPLLTGQALGLMNLVDDSMTLSLNLVYSLSDEGEFFAGISIPTGKKPEGLTIRSENGARPITASMEARYYF